MTKKYNYSFGFWNLLVLVSVKLIVLFFSFLTFRRLNLPVTNFLSPLILLFPSLLLLQAYLYWFFRNRMLNVTYVAIHVYGMLIVNILLPGLFIAVSYILRESFDKNEADLWIVRISRIRYLLFWVLFSVSNIFFILAFMKSTALTSRPIKSADSNDLLHEFVDPEQN